MRKIRTILHTLLLLLLTGTAYGQASVGGNLTSSDTAKCTAVNAGTISLGGENGNVIRWEYSYSGGDPWTPIALTSDSYNYSNLSQNTTFRAVVQVPANLPATSSPITIRIYAASNGGLITAPAEVCTGQPALLQLSGMKGSVLQWEESITNGSTWSTISGSALASQLTRTISQDVDYRVSVKNGACPAVYSTISSVDVSALSVAGTISGTDSVCVSSNTVNLSLSGFNGNMLSWEQSFAASGPWNPAAETTSGLVRNNISQTTFYRVKVTNEACPTVYTAIRKVHVSTATLSGNLTGPTSLCEDEAIALNLVNKSGSVTNWEISSNAGGSWTSLAQSGDLLTALQPSGAYLFRTSVKNEVCPVVVTPNFQVTVHALPTVQFGFSPVCEDQSLAFTNTTAGSNVYNWDFGDNTSSASAQPAHFYQSFGDYNVRLIATSTFGCTDSITQLVHVKARPVADFQILNDTVCGGDIVDFLNSSQLSEGSITSYQWKHVTTVFSTANAAQIQLVQPGATSIQLLVTSNLGCSDSIVKSVNVRPTPVAAFTADNSCEGTVTSFQNLSQIENGTTGYTWSFGDGTTSYLTQVQHQYTSANSYITQLIVRSAYLCADTVSHTVVIHPSPVIDFTVNTTCLGDSAYYVSTVTNAASPVYSWQFGDGATSSVANPTHVFNGFGTYQSTLNVISDSGCVASLSRNPVVHAVPATNFSMANACVNTLSQVMNYSQIASGTLHYEWDFGGTFTSTDMNPDPVFSTAGTFDARLISISDMGCRDTLILSYTVFDQPQSAFTFDNVCYGSTTHFHQTSTVNFGTITGVSWDFGDNSNSTLTDPEKTYLNEGDYNVILIAVSSNGCSDTTTSLVSVYDAPIADFSANNTCLGDEAAFVNTSILNLGVYTSAWQFGDGTTSALFAPNHTYADPGSFQVKLAITSDQGCTDSISKFVQVYALPIVHAGEDVTIDKGYDQQLLATGAVSYTWSPSTGLDAPQISNPVASPVTTQEYTLVGIDQHGCIGLDTLVVIVNESFRLVPYNILTPDGNNQNDTWIVGNSETYPTNKISIFNELGNEVYAEKAYANTWDGRNKTGEILPDGTYYYVITFSDADKVYKGDLLLIRNMH